MTWAAFAVSVALFVASAWPGWMSPDSLGMWDRAVDGPIYDWHSPVLIWAWSFLGAAELGPLIPFLIQSAIFWAGLLLIVGRLQRLGWESSWLLFPAVLFLDAAWMVGWVWKDSLAVAVLILMVGLTASTDLPGLRRWAWLFLPGLGALVVATRWSLAPFVLLALGALFFMMYPVSRRQVLQAIAVFGIAISAVFFLERVVIKPTNSYVAASTMMLDIARVECNLGTPEARARGESLFPAELIRTVPGDDICERFSTYVHDPIFAWPDDPITETSYVFPDSEASMERLRSDWLQVVAQFPGILIEARGKQLIAFLNSEWGMESGQWWSPGQQLSSNEALYSRGSVGDGELVGWPSASGPPVIVTAMLSSIGSLILLDFGSNLFGLLTLVLIPLGVTILCRKRGKLWRIHYLPALGFPIIFAIGIASIVPADDVRYIMPAALWSLAVAALAVCDRRTSDESAKQAESPEGVSVS